MPVEENFQSALQYHKGIEKGYTALYQMKRTVSSEKPQVDGAAGVLRACLEINEVKMH